MRLHAQAEPQASDGAPYIRSVAARRTVTEAFEIAALAYADRPAIRYHGQTWTYRELARLAADIADLLGTGPGAVGVAARHAPGTVAALLGVWAAGGTYCPIDPAYPQPRQQAMLAGAGCEYYLDPGQRPSGANDVDLRVVPNMGAGAAPVDAVAYILFTSGSTGDPKPVMTPPDAIAATVHSLRDLFELTPADRVLQFASMNWDTCFEEILPTLTCGACLVVDDEAHTGSFSRLLRLIEREQVTVLDLPTAFWHELVHFLREDGLALPRCVRLLIIGGEAVSPPRLVDWTTLDTGHARLLNTYGCTETTLITHAVDLCGPLAVEPEQAWHQSSPVPIGRALPHVVEEISPEGELLIGGPAVALGYRGLPEATGARFLTRAGKRFFRTGDRVSRMLDGTVLHEGRLDHEVKIRGIRVDPAEVEAHIAGHPSVGAVAVTGAKVADHTVLVAYVVPRPQAPSDGLVASILDHLRGRVPAHLIPSRIRIVADLVYTASGKVDRKRIKEIMQ